MKRVGVFVCWCGLNISRTVDIERVVKEMSRYPGVVHAVDYKYLCSDPGQNLIREAVAREKLQALVVAACSPAMHELTFRQLAEACGVNPYLCEMANIREQCSWVHDDREKTTEKALALVRMTVEKVHKNEALFPATIPLEKRVLVIGAGISGMQAALDAGDAGHEVVLVERNPYIGGRMAQLSETFPTLDCAQCILTPRTAEVGRHPKIKLLAYSEVAEVQGYVGNFLVKVRRKPTFVDWSKCTGCAMCVEKCPKEVPAEFERGLGTRKAIYVAFPQAVPYRPVIDAQNCLFLHTGKCGVCARLCPAGAVDFQQKETTVEEKVGAIIVATGFETLGKETIGEYGYGKYPDVIDGLQFERINSASGPTEGKIMRPSDGRLPREVVFIQCVGSRDEEKGIPYCSKVCCMYTAKHARLYKHKVPDGQAYVFYMDVRAGGKGYEEFVQRGIEEEGILYLRGRVSRVFPDGDRLVVWGADTLSGKKIEIAADMVVLASAIVPSPGTKELASVLKIACDEHGFLSEAHPKLRPVESLTRGVFVTGCAQAPKDIPEAVAQGSAAVAKVCGLFAQDAIVVEPTIAVVNKEDCSGCFACEAVCPYDAIEREKVTERVAGTVLVREVAGVNPGLCQGCGCCTVACRAGAVNLNGFTNEQILVEVEALCI